MKEFLALKITAPRDTISLPGTSSPPSLSHPLEFCSDIMSPRPRRARRGDAWHREAGATTSESLGKPPFGSRPLIAGGRQAA